jgi:glycosyltransferase involved in cell wall biosynthesis
MRSASISAVVPAYNAERYVGDTLTAILSQTRPPDEVVVVDDGSTDGTGDVLAQFADEIRVVRQANKGVGAAMNRCFEEARGEFVAKCDADDIWQLDKLERQADVLSVWPDVDIAFGGAEFFGLMKGPRVPYPEVGLLDPQVLKRRLYQGNFICASTMLVRRSFFVREGPFDPNLACEDYDFWLRALGAGGVFFHDPAVLVRYRAHPQQVSDNLLRMHEAEYITHRIHADLVEDSKLVARVLAQDLSNIGRVLSDEDREREARLVFISSLGHRRSVRVLGWVAVLSLPRSWSHPIASFLVKVKRTLLSVLRRSPSTHPST